MKRRRFLVLVGMALLTLVLWPWFESPSEYNHWKDRLRTSLPIALVFGPPCSTRDGEVIVFDSSPNCERFDPPKVFEGIWLYAFEGSTFVENARLVPKVQPAYDRSAWLEFNPEKIKAGPAYDDYDEAGDCYPIHAFAIKFIGRTNPGRGGHFGLWASEIWVQRVLRAKALPPPDCKAYYD